MARALVFIVLATIWVIGYATAPYQGFSSTIGYMRASTSIVSLIASLALAVFVAFYPQKSGTPLTSEPVKIWERFAAFCIDSSAVFSVIIPIMTAPILLAEAQATGVFQWSFERDFTRPTDVLIAVPGVLLGLVALFGFFYAHPRFGRQTVGQYILGFRFEGVPCSDGSPSYGRVVFLAYIGFCIWPVSLFFAAKRPDRAFWWNLQTHTRVVRLV